MSYRSLIENISVLFNSRLNEISVHYNLEYGNEFEVALCHVISSFLPKKAGVCRGFVVDSEGNKVGDDIIIYDKSSYNTLRGIRDGDFSLKQQIPIEAVYAYIEAKSTVYLESDNRNTLQKALKQQSQVRELIGKRTRREISDITPYLSLPQQLVQSSSEWPNYKNPPFTSIWTRQVKKTPSSNDVLSADEIVSSLDRMGCDYLIDLLVLGEDCISIPIVKSTRNYSGPFYTNGKYPHLSTVNYGTSYGLGMVSILQAIDWIELSAIDWNKVVFGAIKD
ncbi:putative uncharacterized protein [Aliivibrio wodanis]|uniref:DUF6602 domain-containing protein n=1 Tax=Aliivibrio wodanis TaxID=80852 RepID=A0A090ISQ3_9GAMM|nr:putative uncharacterized protein [Aliivibrio wodanis]